MIDCTSEDAAKREIVSEQSTHETNTTLNHEIAPTSPSENI